MSKITTKHMISGISSPTYWRDVVANESSVAKFSDIKKFTAHALKTIFIDSDKQMCFHYKPKSEGKKTDGEDVVVHKESVYKGPPKSRKDLWVVNGAIVKVTDDYIFVQDKSKTKKLKTKRDGADVDFSGHPLKKLLISNIENITSIDNTPIDMSVFLRKIQNVRTLNRKTKQKNIKNKDNFEKALVGNMKQTANTQSNDGFVNLAQMDTETKKKLEAYYNDNKKKIEDYWSYLDRDYAKALSKKY